MKLPAPNALIGGALIGGLAVAAGLGALWTPYDPLQLSFRAKLAAPGAAHWLGTDEFGRDVLSRLLAGAATSVWISVLTVALAVSFGTLIGIFSGYVRGWLDRIVMAFNDALLAFPGILLALGLLAVLGANKYGIIVALGIAYTPSVARIVRGTVLSLREKEFIAASRVMGNSEAFTMARHILPNCIGPLTVLATSMFGWVLLAESSLSFLGLGVPPPAPTWGNMLAGSRAYIGQAVWLGIFPGLCISLTLLGINLLGDAVRDRLDPRMRGAAMKDMAPIATTPLLVVRNLTLRIGASGKTVVNNVGFSISPGEIVGIVGESGSGKTLAARAVMGFVPPAVRMISGSILFDGQEVTTMPQKRLRAMRGARVGMVFQEPMTSLNPSMLIGKQLDEGLALHRKLDAAARRALVLDMLRRVGLRDPEGALTAYPHQFSGGMRQRIMLASVMLLKPALLLADEPTTALDAVVQRDVMELMVDLTTANGTAVLLISHDLGMVARYCSRIVVMCQGDVVEHGAAADILARPQHAYTRKLLAAMPHRSPARALPEAPAPIVAVRDLVVDYPGRQGFFRKEAAKRALHGISLEVQPRQVVAVVGGSGSGKTTLGQTIAGLIKPTGGDILFNGKPIFKSDTAFWDYRLNCQMVFQDPYSSLDPRMTIQQLIAEPLRLVPGMGSAERAARVAEVLAEVGLADGFASRYPHELSGGQRQRIAIARAVVRRPSFVIADEPVSALDVTVRAQVLELFAELQRKHGFSCLFISHDLGVVEQVADRVVVMQEGRIVEEGPRDQIFDDPQHDYTRKLLSAVPGLESTDDGGVRLFWRLGEPEAER